MRGNSESGIDKVDCSAMVLRLALPATLMGVVICLAVGSAAFAQSQYGWIETETPASFNLSGVLKSPGQGATNKSKIVINYTTQEDHYAVAFVGQELRALRVKRGKVFPLWQPRNLPRPNSDGAYAFVIKRRPGRLMVVVNGELMGRAEGVDLTGGKVGTITSGEAHFESVRSQEVEPVYFTDDFMRTSAEKGAWETVSGKWVVKAIDTVEPDPARSANPFSYLVTTKDKALATAGYWFWDNYLYRVAVRPESTGAVGLLVFYQDPRNYGLFRWWSNDSPHAGKARELVWVKDGRERVQSATGSGYQPGQWYQMAVRATDVRLEGFIDGASAFASASPPFSQGKIGLYAEQCERASFDDALCRHWENPSDDPSPSTNFQHITPQFSLEETMSNWTRPENDWSVAPDGWRWNRGDFWGDASLSLELPQPAQADSQVTLVIHADAQTADSGYALTLAPNADHSALQWTLKRQGKILEQKQATVADWPLKVELWRQGKALRIGVGDEPAVSLPDPNPLQGTHVGVQTTGILISAQVLKAAGTHFMDDTFASAPVNWWQAKGKWSVMNRWSCQPGWSWFTGTGSLTPVVWSKRSLAGDFVVEAFVANKMDLPGFPGYSHPGDLNLTVCGDGRSIDSGYSCIYAGWNNTVSGMFRQDDRVAQNTSAVISNPTDGGNLAVFHRHWFCLRVERHGNQLKYSVDGQLIAQYEDPKPIPSGRFALWTCDNESGNGGIVVARVRAWYEHEAPAEDLPASRVLSGESGPWDRNLPPVPETTTAIKHDFESDVASWSGFNRRDGAVVTLDTGGAASGKRSLKIENAAFGGDLSVWAGVGVFDALKLRKLKFSYKVPDKVKVNLYLQAQGGYYAIEFTGGTQPAGTCPTLGKIEGAVADNQWHTAQFDLGAALLAIKPGSDKLPVSLICFAAPKTPYYRVGLGGNGWHSAYHIDDFELGP